MAEDPHQTGAGIKGITRDIRQYIEKRLELFVLTFSDQLSQIVASSIQRAAGILLLYTGFIFAWSALGYLLADLTGSLALGFLLSSLPLLLAGFLFLKLKPEFVIRKIKTELVQDILKSLDSVAKGRQEKPETGSNDGMEEKHTEQKA